MAEPAAGYRFDGWHSDGRTNPGPVLCDGSGGSSNYSGSGCQFATTADLQVRARFVDDTAPAMFSLSGPSQPVNGAATFSFSAAADPTFRSFECRIGGVHEWQTCSSGYAPNLATGSYTLEVRALDWSGNRSAESTWGWTVDKIAPETSLAPTGPSGTVASSSASFDFNSNESSSFVCSLNGVAVSCGSPKTYTNLAPGNYTFSARARDLAGNEDPSPAVRTWTVDTVAPETTLDSGPTGSTTATSAEFAFSSEPGVRFRCQLDSQAVEVGCSSPRGFSGLAVGDHTFKVWATDAAGNADPTPATRTWTVTSAATTGTTPTTPTTTPDPTTSLPTTPGGSADTTGPLAVLSFASQRLARVLRRGLAGSASITEPGTLVLDVLYRGRKVATAKRAATKAGSFKLVARLTAKGKRALRRARSARLTLRLTAKDAAGNVTVRRKAIRLRR